VPTGVAIPGVRAQLFDAAERVLLRAGADALTSRAVTTEAGVAKGVLHRHFADFDTFLAELVLDRTRRIDEEAGVLRGRAGTGTVAGNLSGALMDVFATVAVGLVALVASRNGLRARLRQTERTSVPVLTAAGRMIASYLTAERELGRIAPDADVNTLAPTLVGAVHLVFTDSDAVSREAVEKVVRAVITSVVCV
jgi:AcrR family transcriptional regulator